MAWPPAPRTSSCVPTPASSLWSERRRAESTRTTRTGSQCHGHCHGAATVTEYLGIRIGTRLRHRVPRYLNPNPHRRRARGPFGGSSDSDTDSDSAQPVTDTDTDTDSASAGHIGSDRGSRGAGVDTPLGP